MSARDRLIEALMNPGLVGFGREESDELIANYAHELAEEIREERDQMREEMPGLGGLVTQDTLDTLSYAANLVDPYDTSPAGSEEKTG